MRHESTGLSLCARDKFRAAILSGVAGYVDAACIVSVVALFPAHVTGELVSEVASFSAGHVEGVPSRLWMLPTFVLAVALAATLARFERRRGRIPLAALLLLVSLGLAAFALSGVALLLAPQFSPATVTHLGACCAVAAMGFQNALMRESLHGAAPTTFMTGNLTQLVIEIVDHLFAAGRRPGIVGDVERSVSRARLTTAAIALSSFLGSALIGAYLTRTIGPVGTALPAALVALLGLQASRERVTRTAADSLASATVGMRRPTPITRPFDNHNRVESGTRFKAVRPSDPEKKAGDG